MSNLIRHVIVKDGVVVNAVEYDATAKIGGGLEDGHSAIASDIAQIGWSYDGVLFTAPPVPVPPIADARSLQSQNINGSAASAIVGGFSSLALGAENTYPSTLVDQQNINAVAMVGGALWCGSAAGVWALTLHTKAQATAVQADMVAHIQAQQIKNATLQAAISAATTVAEIQAVIW